MNKQINAIFTDELPEEVRLASERDKEPKQKCSAYCSHEAMQGSKFCATHEEAFRN